MKGGTAIPVFESLPPNPGYRVAIRVIEAPAPVREKGGRAIPVYRVAEYEIESGMYARGTNEPIPVVIKTGDPTTIKSRFAIPVIFEGDGEEEAPTTPLTPYGEFVVASNPFLYVRFEDSLANQMGGTGLTIPDVTYTPGAIGQSGVLEAATAYGESPVFSGNLHAGTVVVIVKFPNLRDFGDTTFFEVTSTEGESLALLYCLSGDLYLSWGGGFTQIVEYYPDEFTMIGITWDFSGTPVLSIYVNGVSMAHDTGPSLGVATGGKITFYQPVEDPIIPKIYDELSMWFSHNDSALFFSGLYDLWQGE